MRIVVCGSVKKFSEEAMAKNDTPTNEPTTTSAPDTVEELNKSKIYESHERGATQTPSTVSDTHKGSGLDRNPNNTKPEPLETVTQKAETKQDNDITVVEKSPLIINQSPNVSTDIRNPSSADVRGVGFGEDSIVLGRVSRNDDASLIIPRNGQAGGIGNRSTENIDNFNIETTESQTTNDTTTSTQTNRDPQSAEIILGAVAASEDTPFALGISLDQHTLEGLVDIKYTITAPLGTKLYINNQELSPSTPGGMYIIDAEDISQLTALPPKDYSGELIFNISAAGILPSTNEIIIAPGKILSVNVNAIADTPTLIYPATVTGNEDTPVLLNIQALQTDSDGSEVISIKIQGVPASATLNHGIKDQVTGDWILSQADLLNLTITAPPHYSGTLNLNVIVSSTEPNNSQALNTGLMSIIINPVVDGANVTVTQAHGNEDGAIPLSFSVTSVDPSETFALEIQDIPVGAVLSDGIHTFSSTQSNNSVNISTWSLGSLTIKPPLNDSREFTLSLKTTTSDGNAAASSSITKINVTVDAVADQPILSAPASIIVNEDPGIAGSVALDINAALYDTDGSEKLTLEIQDIPIGTRIFERDANGVIVSRDFTATSSTSILDITGWNLANIRLIPPLNRSDGFDLIVIAKATEQGTDGTIATPTALTQTTIHVTINAVADAPTLTVGVSNTDEGAAVPLSLIAAVTDNVDIVPEHIKEYTVAGLPIGSVLSDGTQTITITTTAQIVALDPSHWNIPSLAITPPPYYNGSIHLTVTATSVDVNNTTATTTVPVSFTVATVATPPVFDNNAVSLTFNEDNSSSLFSLNPQLVDRDGSESLQLFVTNLPAGLTITDGSAGHTYTSTGISDLINLTNFNSLTLQITSPHDYSGTTFNADFIARSTESNNITADTHFQVPVTVNPIGDAPALTTSFMTVNEDTVGTLTINTQVQDTDTSETMTSLVVANIPVGVTIKLDATHSFTATSGHTSLDLIAAGWVSPFNDTATHSLTLQVIPVANYSGNFNLTVTATTTELLDGTQHGVTTNNVNVGFTPVADAPLVSITNATGLEDTFIQLNPTATLVDVDGPESLTALTISNVPTGATLEIRDSGGTVVHTLTGNASYNLLDYNYGAGNSLYFKAPSNYPTYNSSVINLTLTATSKDGTDTASTTQGFTVTVAPDADAPATFTVPAAPVSISEEGTATVVINFALADIDGTETYKMFLDNLPSGLLVTDNGGHSITVGATGTIDVTGFNLNALTFSLASKVDYGGEEYGLTGNPLINVRAEITDSAGNVTSTKNVSQQFTLNIVPVAENANIITSASSGNEDEKILLNFTAGVKDPSEVMTSLMLKNIPTGSKIFFEDANGNVTLQSVSSGQIDLVANGWTTSTKVYVQAPKDSDVDFNLSLQATTKEPRGGDTHLGPDVSLPVVVNPVGDNPLLTTQFTAVNEDTPGTLIINTQVQDIDASETMTSLVISNIPVGVTIMLDANHTFTSTPSQTSLDLIAAGWVSPFSTTTNQHLELQVIPVTNYSGNFNLNVTATTTEALDGTQHGITSSNVNVVVNPIGDAPALTTSFMTVNEDTVGTLTINTQVQDTDTSETMTSLVVANIPVGVTIKLDATHSFTATSGHTSLDLIAAGWVSPFNDTATHSLTLQVIPVANYSGNFNLTVTATTTELLDGTQHGVTTNNVNVGFTPVADAPLVSITNATGLEDTFIQLNPTATLVDVDGPESLTALTISNVPTGATLEIRDSGGTVVHTLTGNASYNLLDYNYGAGNSLYFKAPSNYPTYNSSVINLTLTATSKDGTDTASTTQGFTVTVAPDADAPATFTVPAAPVSISEEGTATVVINFALADIDGTETYKMFLDNLPSGLLVTDNGGHSITVGATGTIDVTGFNLNALTFSLASKVDYGGEEYGLTGNPLINVRAEITDSAGNVTSTKNVSQQFTLNIVPVAENANIITSASSGNEDEKILLNFTAGVKDPSEVMTSLMLKNIPTGSKIFFEDANGNVTLQSVSSGQIDLVANGWTTSTKVYVQAPKDSDVDFNLSLQATTKEPRGGDTHLGPDISLPVVVTAIADAPIASAQNRNTLEDTRVNLVLNGALTDIDLSETIKFDITGDLQGGKLQLQTATNTFVDIVPVGGHYSVSAADISKVYYMPSLNFNGAISLNLQSISQEANNSTATGTNYSPIVPFTITVTPVLDAPTGGANFAVTTYEDTWVSITTPAFVNPDSGHETMAVKLNLPIGWSVQATGHAAQTIAALGGVDVTGWTGIQILPPKDSNVNVTTGLSFTATTTNPALPGQTANTTRTFTVDVKSVVDDFTISPITSNTTTNYSPTVLPNGLYGFEDPTTNAGRVNFTNNFLNVTKASDNQDGSETFTYKLDLISNGVTSTDGSIQTNLAGFNLYYNGTLVSKTGIGWTLTQAQMNNQGALSLQGPKDFSGKVGLIFTVINTDTDLNNAADTASLTKSSSFDVMIYGIADKPTLAVSNVFGNEDSYIPLKITGTLTDLTDENLFFVIDGVPNAPGAGLFINTGAGGYVNISTLLHTRKIDGTTTDQWIIKATDIMALTNGSANLTTLNFKPPLESNQDFTFTVQTKSAETNNPSSSSFSDPQSFTVNVKGIANTPVVTKTTAEGIEDTQFDLHTLLIQSGELANAPLDSSERLSIVIDMNTAPAGSTISGAIPLGGNLWSYSGGTILNLSSIKITPPANYSGQFNLGIKVVATEDDGNSTSQSITLPVHITPVVDRLTISGGGSGYEDGNQISGNIHSDDSGGGIPVTINLNAADTLGTRTGENSAEKLDSIVYIKILTPGATFAGLTPDSNGEYAITIPANQSSYTISNLILVPPIDFGGTIELTTRARTYEVDATSPNTPIYGSYTSQLINVTVRPDADVPVISNASFVDLNPLSTDVEVYRDNVGAYVYQVKFDITNNDHDVGGTTSEGLSYRITVPEGCAVVGGISLGNNTWLISLANSNDSVITQNLEIRVPLDFQIGSEFKVSITPYSTEQLNGDTQAGQTVTLINTFISDSGSGNGGEDGVTDQHVKEDSVISLTGTASQIATAIETTNATITVSTTDSGDMKDLLIFDATTNTYTKLSTYADGTSINVGGATVTVHNAGGIVTLEAASTQDLQAIKLMPPLNSNEDFTLSFAVVPDIGNPQTFDSTIVVVGVADPVTFAGPATFTTNEGMSVALAGIILTPVDNDGSETVTAYIQVPNASFTVTGAIQDPTDPTRWIITNSSTTSLDLSSISITPPTHYVGDATIKVIATTQENDGDTETTQQDYTLHFNPVSNGGTIVSTLPTGTEDSPLSLANITTNLIDSSETLGNYIVTVPAGFQITGSPSSSVTNANGSITYTLDNNLSSYNLIPPANYSGSTTIQIATTSAHDSGGNVSPPVSINGNVNVTFDPVVDGVSFPVSDPIANGSEDSSGIVLPLSYTLIDSSETVQSVIITGVPAGYQIANANNNGDGSWVIANLTALGNVKLIPPKDASAQIELGVQVITAESNGATKTDTDTLHINVRPVADLPLIFKTPDTIQVSEDVSSFKLQNVVNNNLFELVSQDSDGSEKLFLEVRGNTVPNGFDIVDTNGQSYQKTDGNGVYWDIPQADLAVARVILPANYSTPLAGIALTATARSEDTSTIYPSGTITDTNHSIPTTVTLIVNPVVDQAIINNPSSFTISEDPSTPTPITGLSIALADTDGSEKFTSISFSGLITGTQIYIGSALIGTSTGTANVINVPNPENYGSLSDVRLQQPANFPTSTTNSLGTLSITATTTEMLTGELATITKSFPVTVNPVVDIDTATFDIANVSYAEPQVANQFTVINSGVFASISDTNSENITHLEIKPPAGALPAGLASWADVQFKLGSTTVSFDGSKWSFDFTTTTPSLSGLSVKAPQYFDGQLNFNSEITVVDKSGVLQDSATKTDTFAVTITPVSSAISTTVPTNAVIHENVSHTDAGSLLSGFAVGLIDTSETISSIQLKLTSDVGSVKLFLSSNGTELPADGNGYWTLHPSDLANIRVEPPADYNGVISGIFTVLSQDGTATTLTTSKNFVITVDGVANEPTIAANNVSVDGTTATFDINAAISDTYNPTGSEFISQVILKADNAITITHNSITQTLAAGEELIINRDTNNLEQPWSHISVESVDDTDATLSITAVASENSTSASHTIDLPIAFDHSEPLEKMAFSTSKEIETAPDAAYMPIHLEKHLPSLDGINMLEISGLPEGIHLVNHTEKGYGNVGVTDGKGTFYITPSEAKNLYIEGDPKKKDLDLDVEIKLHSADKDHSPVTVDLHLDFTTGHIESSGKSSYYEGVHLVTSSSTIHDISTTEGGYMTASLNDLGFMEYHSEHGATVNGNGEAAKPEHPDHPHKDDAITDSTPAADIGSHADHLGTVTDHNNHH